MVPDIDPPAVAPFESFTATAYAKVPVEVGVPDITPDGLSERPAGKAPPISNHRYGGRPPSAESWIAYGDPVTGDTTFCVATYESGTIVCK
jgi:hypothetical protein